MTIGIRTAVAVATFVALTLNAAVFGYGEEPPGCNGTATGMAIEALFEGNPTLDPVVEGQVIFFRLTVVQPLPNGCNYFGGQLSVTHPDGLTVNLAGFGGSTPDIPVVNFLTPFQVVSPVPYIVTEADAVNGILTARGDYGATTPQPLQVNGTFQTVPEQPTASATTSLPLPLGAIDIQKTPSVDTVCDGNEVTYTYEVTTGPGAARVLNVIVEDDLCDDVVFIGGDTNGNDILNINETWIYECTSTLFQTTTNTATASGQLITTGVTVTDEAMATVTVFPTPSVEISGPSPVCPGQTNILYTATETSTPPLPGAIFDWTITGDATFCDGGTISTGDTVCVNADFTCNGSYTLFVTVTVGDCVNENQLTVTIVDDTPPVLVIPPDITFDCDAVGDAGTATVTDDCDLDATAAFIDVVTPGTCPQESTITRTWSSTDACGNASSGIQTITIQDVTPPTIICPPDMTFECDEAINGGIATATDNCDPMPLVTSSDVETPGACPQERVITRTWTATDDCGNSSNCVQTITIEDTTPPVITCPPSVTFECDAVGDEGMATATDNCDPDPVITSSDVVSAGNCPQEMVTTRTWTATDACGNVSTCVQTIIIEDTTPPVITCPPSATFECDAVGNFGVAAATDNCDPMPMITSSDMITPGNCPQEMITTRTWTATDACGNSSSCVQIITIEDTTPPVITCPPDVTFECDNVGNFGVAAATDNCDPMPMITSSDMITPGNCPQEMITTRTWTATDACGNSSSCVQIITIEDTTPPVITCPPSVTFECDAIGDAGTATATDNCDPAPMVVFEDVLTPGTCPQEMLTTRTWTATDACGNTSTCIQTISTVDTTPPVITCPPNTTFSCDNIGDPGAASAIDNCDPAPLVELVAITEQVGACPQEIMQIRTWTATDACGNSRTCSQTVLIYDNTPPTITCPADVTFECDAVGDAGTATAVDNCDPNPDISSSDVVTPGNCPQEMVITRTWTATDGCGNADACVQTITIRDTTPPTIVCPPGFTFECDTVGNYGEASAFDNCDPNPMLSFEDEFAPGNCPNESITTRTWTATDACGNSSSCVQIIEIVDTTPPTVICPPDLVFECDAVGPFGSATAEDNCDSAPVIDFNDVVTDGACPQESLITRTWSATDACGNVGTCVQTITIRDTTQPVVTCPADLTFECDAIGDFGMPSATDNCDPNPEILLDETIVPGSCPQETVIHRVYIARDACGNKSLPCTQTITIVDTTPPAITCPADATFECNAVGTFGVATATDNCDPSPTVAFSDVTSPGACLEASVITRTWTATDACGNASTCVQTITIVDTTPPVITCPPDATFECNAVGDAGTATATDNCDLAPVITSSDVTSPGQCPQASIITRTWTATDACGNSSSCVQTISIVDTTPPVIFCPQNVHRGCNEEGDTGQATATDNCESAPVISFSDSVSAGACPQESVVSRTWTATDACGNSASCVQTITTSDLNPPAIYCPVDRTFECSNIGDFGDATATDDCDGSPVITVLETEAPGTCPQERFIIRSFTAEDACGNTSICVQVITIVDTTPPAISCPTNMVIECADMDTIPDATATDNCDPDPVVTAFDNMNVGVCPGEMIITRRWTATDACGNSSSCVQQITIIDTTPPTITCPPDTTVDCPVGDSGSPIVSDACDDNPVVSFFDSVFDPGLCPGNEIIERTWTAVDACGNLASCTQMLTVICPPTATIGNRIWEDTNGDGIQDLDEPGLGGVTLYLFGGCDGDDVIDQTMTDDSGFYEFASLCAGEYLVMVDPTTLPLGYVATQANIGDDAFDSDGVDGLTCVVLTSDQTGNPTIDCGFVPPSCEVSCVASLVPAPANGCLNGDPALLTFRYTGTDCNASSHEQDADFLDCAHMSTLPGTVLVIASDRLDPFDEDATIWFDGLVDLNATFDIAAGNGGADQLSPESFIHLFDAEGAELLQSAGIDTSCGQPLFIGDRFGANLLIGGVGTEGPIEAGQSNRIIIGSEITAGACELTTMIDIGCDIIEVPNGQMIELLCPATPGDPAAPTVVHTTVPTSGSAQPTGAAPEDNQVRTGGPTPDVLVPGPCPYFMDGDLLTIQSGSATLIVSGLDAAGNSYECELDLCDFLASGDASRVVDGHDDLYDDETAPCPEDVTLDGRVDMDDLVAVLMQWGPVPDGHACDLTGDLMVNADDIVTLVVRWGLCD